ncbi:dimethyladenosine transferase [Pyricularia oryzae 70-15]|uniref:rRNA adenine N(6)-methyltransferase n=3 Tax=Pyricularia oryzae TaxID=318829 RepID=G4NDI6_PYRO7|nr:dimethyladenosine transferase [Pyricularia oryzae 70-15]EHA49271.1 dimethyladenosine transferase [Pyricularia oryzae 70-15]ELQ36004.1 dimethyladenosine transferase [Pyricularia oryzae Y34]KAI7917486.1 dimethyladenosine transferase [Pyricularia oryzae]
MGKVKTPRRAGAASSSPYDRKGGNNAAAAAAAAPTKNNVFRFKKDYGQHILKNPGIAEEIVKKAYLRPTDTVLEVGPGTGNLSVKILERAQKLIAVELDPRMGAELTKRVQGKPEQRKLEVILGDVIKADLPPFDVLISNTPYQISSPLVFKMLALPNPPRCMVLMFQREFSSRLTARPGEALYSRLSVNVQLFSKVTHIMKVGKANFKPPPQVESSVVRIEPKLGRERPNVSWEEWDGMLRVCFNRKNKTLHASFLGVKEVLAMAERNYKVWCTMNDIPIDESVVETTDGDVEMDADDGEWGGIMDVDEDGGDAGDDDDVPEFFKEKAPAPVAKTPSKRKKTKVGELVRSKIEKVLKDTDLAEQRANKCDQNDFLRLLAAFNAEGIHFA